MLVGTIRSMPPVSNEGITNELITAIGQSDIMEGEALEGGNF
jgi:hypothetical protein